MRSRRISANSATPDAKRRSADAASNDGAASVDEIDQWCTFGSRRATVGSTRSTQASQERSRVPVASLSDDARRALEHDAALLTLELRDRSPSEIYRLAFARLLQPDPRPSLCADRFTRQGAMLGTDERDLFVEVVDRYLIQAESPLRILDVGAGDGQTFALFADQVPAGSTVHGIEPNEAYAQSYEQLLGELPFAKVQCDATRFWTWSEKNREAPPFDLVLALHSIYFLGDVEPLLERLRAHLAPGGTAILVFADEIEGFTGRCVSESLTRAQEPEASLREARLAERHAVLVGESGLERLSRLGFERVTSELQPSRLYGHTFRDLLALGFITDLAFSESLPLRHRVNAVARQLTEAPSALGLAIEVSEPRVGMLSVLEPQIVTVLRRRA